MNEQILINVTPQETRVAVTEQCPAHELHIERASSRALTRPGETGGFIGRTVAEAANEAALTADMEYLVKLWKQSHLAAQSAAPQALLYQDLALATRVVRDVPTD